MRSSFFILGNLIFKIFEMGLGEKDFLEEENVKWGGEMENEIGESDDQCSLCVTVEYLQKCKLATAT